jgi:hypothetical protein
VYRVSKHAHSGRYQDEDHAERDELRAAIELWDLANRALNRVGQQLAHIRLWPVLWLQMELGEGPCLQAHASGVPVFLPDLEAEGANRWPAFAAAALAAGVHAEFSLPLTVGPGGIGTLDLCRDRPGMLSEEHVADALVTADIARDAVLYQPQAIGEMAPIGLIQERALRERSLLTEQLQAALTSRVVIEQAKGMLAEYLRMTVDDAFQLLRSYARDRNRKLSEVARDVVDRKIPSTALIPSPGQGP